MSGNNGHPDEWAREARFGPQRDQVTHKTIVLNDPWHVNREVGQSYQVTVVREVTTTYKFYVRPGQDPREAYDDYIRAVGVQRIIRHSEPRPL